MQSIKQVIENNQLSTFSGLPAKAEQTSTLQINPNNDSRRATAVTIDKRIETLFLRLGAIYGHIWWSIYKNGVLLEVTKKEWSESLQRFNNAILKEALLKFREEKGFPPSLPQFIECCKAIQKRGEPCDVKKAFKPGSPEIAKMHIQAMLKLLKS